MATKVKVVDRNIQHGNTYYPMHSQPSKAHAAELEQYLVEVYDDQVVEVTADPNADFSGEAAKAADAAAQANNGGFDIENATKAEIIAEMVAKWYATEEETNGKNKADLVAMYNEADAAAQANQ